MAFRSPPGATVPNKQVAQNLAGAIGGVSGPVNPNTKDIRTDPREVELLDLQRIRRALERAMESGDESDPIQKIHSAAKTLYTRILAGSDPIVALQAASVSLSALIPPPTPPAPVAPSPGGALGGPAGPGGTVEPGAPASMSPGVPPG